MEKQLKKLKREIGKHWHKIGFSDGLLSNGVVPVLSFDTLFSKELGKIAMKEKGDTFKTKKCKPCTI